MADLLIDPNTADELKVLMDAPPALTLAVAESLTSGHVQARIAAGSGASTYFLGGITAYTLEQKVRHLGVDRAAGAAVDSVSAEIAAQMARGACTLFGSDLAVATTGFAEAPPPGRGDVPFAWWALAHRTRGTGWTERSQQVSCPAGTARVLVQARVADAVIAALLAYLREWRRK